MLNFDNYVYKERNKMIIIADEFNKWLNDMSEKYDMDKDEIQQLIKDFLR